MRKRNQKVEQLRELEVFRHCSTHELERIAAAVDRIDLEAGRVLCREGQRGRECFVIIDGEVEVSIEGTRVGTVGPGELLGEVGVFSGRPRMATAVATGPVSAYVVHISLLEALVESPAVARSLVRTLSERLAVLDGAATA
jgi:CRP/FNR family transcriptional regulator, cyclic AMP receptor protein